MDVFPKFIIEDGNLIISKVTYHQQMVTDKTKVRGGGWFTINNTDKTITLTGESYDFGKASLESIIKCIEDGNVYSDKYLMANITNEYKFLYNTGIEILILN